MSNFNKVTASICFAAAVLKKRFPHRLVTKFLLQKLLFIFVCQRNFHDWGYALKNGFGPSSDFVDLCLGWAVVRGYMRSKEDKRGKYFVFQEVPPDVMDALDNDEKKLIAQIVENYASYSQKELSFITTALYMKNVQDITDKKLLIDLLADAHPEERREYLKNVILEHIEL